MSIFKRGNVYSYHFLFNGEHFSEEHPQGNPRTARQMKRLIARLWQRAR
jgi:hypothetical protein